MTTTAVNESQVIAQGKAAQSAARKLSRLPAQDKNRALLNIAEALEGEPAEVLAANQQDYEEARANGLEEAMLDRLLLSPERLRGTAQEVRSVAGLPDPVGEKLDPITLPNGLHVEKRRVPLGVIERARR